MRIESTDNRRPNLLYRSHAPAEIRRSARIRRSSTAQMPRAGGVRSWKPVERLAR